MINYIKTSEEFNKILEANKTNNKIILVDFYADWCGPCKMLAPIIEEIDQDNNNNQKENNIIICKINVDENSDLAQKYLIQSIPTIIVFKNGDVYKKSIGLVPKTEILNMIS